MTTPAFHLLKGTVRVSATGYWYTGGGEKGSFGFYPHLKTESLINGKLVDLPVYPDTQLHGDLRMAALWARELGAEGRLMDRLFGREGNESAALLHLGDLTLTPASRKLWRSDRFQVKPRIQIDDASRSVKKGMLANFQAAWLHGLTLEAPLFAGYFASADDLAQARTLLDEAATLLSGFGALRSRGYGRGTVRISWDEPEAVTIVPSPATTGRLAYALEGLVNLRSKPVAAEQLQLVGTNLSVTAEQLRGWLVRNFHTVTGRWPDAEEMATLLITDLHPSPQGEAAFPPAMSTLRREDGAGVEDYWGRPPKEDSSSLTEGETQSVDEDARKNKIKLKPLKPGSFVTVGGRIHQARLSVRMRNAMEDGVAGGEFRTRKVGGLFVQQYLAAGSVFRGEITFTKPDSEFSSLVHAILAELKPTINGTLFTPLLKPLSGAKGTGPLLVTMPIPFIPGCAIANGESIAIGNQRRYSAVLGRPRRGRPVILPGSVQIGEQRWGTTPWAMFGKPLPNETTTTIIPSTYFPPAHPIWIDGLGIAWKEITRSQAGNLRELLNTDHNQVLIGRFLDDIRAKHADKCASSDLAKLYTELCAILKREQLAGLQKKVGELLEYLKVEFWWEKKKESKRGDA